jgi:hypothetical protein
MHRSRGPNGVCRVRVGIACERKSSHDIQNAPSSLSAKPTCHNQQHKNRNNVAAQSKPWLPKVAAAE